jgi:hypothetical protein
VLSCGNQKLGLTWSIDVLSFVIDDIRFLRVEKAWFYFTLTSHGAPSKVQMDGRKYSSSFQSRISPGSNRSCASRACEHEEDRGFLGGEE